MLTQDFQYVRCRKAFTEQEKMILYQCMLPDLEIIDNKAMDSVSVVRKGEAWRRVTSRYNSHPGIFQRTQKQLQKCYENAKCRKQWPVTPGFEGTGILQSVGQIASIRSANAAPTDNFSPNKVNRAFRVPVSENTTEFSLYEDHPAIEERLDNIKCELPVVDLEDEPDDEPEERTDSLTIVEAQVQPTLADIVEQVNNTEYPAGQRSSFVESLTTDGNIGDGLEDGDGAIFIDQPIYQSNDVQRTYNPRKRPRRRSDPLQIDSERSNDDHATKTARNKQIEELEERLLRAQVREAEAAASAAQLQLQLNQLALQHAQAEEGRRKQLHALRVRQLSQLSQFVREPPGGDR